MAKRRANVGGFDLRTADLMRRFGPERTRDDAVRFLADAAGRSRYTVGGSPARDQDMVEVIGRDHLQRLRKRHLLEVVDPLRASPDAPVLPRLVRRTRVGTALAEEAERRALRLQGLGDHVRLGAAIDGCQLLETLSKVAGVVGLLHEHPTGDGFAVRHHEGRVVFEGADGSSLTVEVSADAMDAVLPIFEACRAARTYHALRSAP